MSAKTKTALKAESNSTFTTNGVRAITAASHRVFNDDLIDSLDVVVVDKKGVLTYPQIKTEYILCGFTLGNVSNVPYRVGWGDGFEMSKVKDSLLTNIISMRMVHFVISETNLNPSTEYSTYPIVPMLLPSNPLILAYKVTPTAQFNSLGTNYFIMELIYIPETV